MRQRRRGGVQFAPGRRIVLAALCALLTFGAPARAGKARWLRLPPTPTLPAPRDAGTVEVNGAHIWRAVFGTGEPVVLLHGGLANSNYWGDLVRKLAKTHEVVVIDSRGHGRSDTTDAPYSYRLMADDVLGVMDGLGLKTAAIIGWSDGAIIGLDLAMRRPERVSRLFAYAANYDPGGVRDARDVLGSPVFAAFVRRARAEYAELSPTPGGFDALRAGVEAMWRREPNYTPDDLRAIRVKSWIVDGDHDEAIKPEHTKEMAALIPGARLVIEPATSHFGLLQNPPGFYADVARFLAEK